jgi:hypothetical protein
MYATTSIAETSKLIVNKSLECPRLSDPKNSKNIKEWSRLTEPEKYCVMPPRPSNPPCFGVKKKDETFCTV